MSISLNPDLLKKLLGVICKFCNSHDTGTVLLTWHGPGKPLRIDADGIDQQLMALLMPIRADSTEVA